MDKNLFLIRLSESDRTECGRVEFARQTEPRRVFSAIWTLESEVNNGGFALLFENAERDVIAYALTALHAIGAQRCAAIVKQALQVIGPLPETEAEFQRRFQALAAEALERLDALDEKFFEYPDDLTELLFDYVRRHPEAFGPVPE